MQKNTYHNKVVKASTANETVELKVSANQKGIHKGGLEWNKKTKKKKPRSVAHAKRQMEVEESQPSNPTSDPCLDVSDSSDQKKAHPKESEDEGITDATVGNGTKSSSTVVEEDDDIQSKKHKEKDKDVEVEKKSKEETGSKEEVRKDDSKIRCEEQLSKTDEPLIKKDELCAPKTKTLNISDGASPKSCTPLEGQDAEDVKSVGSPGPKVPPLKIVIPQAETDQGCRNGKNNNRHHPYVVVSNDDTAAASSTITTSSSSPSAVASIKDEPPSSPVSASTSNAAQSSEDSKVQQRVLRSTHSNRGQNASSSNGSASASNNNSTSGNSSPAAPDLHPSIDQTTVKDELNVIKVEPTAGAKGSKSITEPPAKNKLDTISVKTKLEPEEELSTPVNSMDSRSCSSTPLKEEPIVELHPRKRKLKTKQEPVHQEVDSIPSFSAAPHPHEVPVTNCYQMFMDIRRQIDIKRKGLFPIQPKPPQGFKEYLMNRCTYTLAGNSISRLKSRVTEAPEGVPEVMKELYLEQESSRHSLRMQHIVEKEKLVLSVEQEILRVHGRAARALANQALPFSACTILKDEEVYNVITPEQEEKDRNARSRYNGRLFISWLQDVDDKWEKIKEEMLARHHKEAESLHAVQKFKWDVKMRQLGLMKKKNTFYSVDENWVPMISVSDDFDLLPE